MKYLLMSAMLTLYLATVTAQKQGQARVDSLLEEVAKTKHDTLKVLLLDNVARAYMLFNPREEFKYMEQGLQLAEKLGWKRGIANLNNDLGLMIGDTGNNAGAIAHFRTAYALDKELGAKINQVNELNNIGRIYQRESNFPAATENFFNALALAEEIKAHQKIALVCTNITNSFFSQKNYAKALEYAEMGLKYGELAKSPNDIGKSLLHLGSIKLVMNDSAAASA